MLQRADYYITPNTYIPAAQKNHFIFIIFLIIHLQEFLLAIDVTSSGTPEEKLKWAFRMYDVDGNGVIDIQEMTKIVQVNINLCTT